MTTEELKQKIGEILGENEELLCYTENRMALADKKYIPDFHFSSPGGYLNDPCGYCFYKGVYHLFYQFGPPKSGKTGWGRHAGKSGWGHAVSVDMIHWIDLPAAIMPTCEAECGSGGVLIEEGRALAFYQGDIKGKKGGAIHIAESTDELLINWQRLPQSPIITTYNEDGSRNPYIAFDPYVWKDGGTYYLLSAGGGSLPHETIETDERDFRRSYLFTSDDLVNWKYHHHFIENDRFADIGDDGACPYFMPVGNGKHLLLHFSHMSGGHYIVGTYDRENLKFIAEQGGDFNRNGFYSGTHAPSAFVGDDSKVHAIFNINYGYHVDSENQIMSLARTFSLDENDVLLTAPDGDYASLRYDGVHADAFHVPANTETVIPGIEGKALEIKMTVDTPNKRSDVPFMIPSNNIPVFEVRVLRSPDAEEYTTVRFFRNRSKNDWKEFLKVRPHWIDAAKSVVEVDTSHSTLSGDIAIHPTESQELYISPNEPIDLHIFVDKSIVEVFANGKKCISVRTYPTRDDSTGVSVMSRGVPVDITYDIHRMKKIF